MTRLFNLQWAKGRTDVLEFRNHRAEVRFDRAMNGYFAIVTSGPPMRLHGDVTEMSLPMADSTRTFTREEELAALQWCERVIFERCLFEREDYYATIDRKLNEAYKKIIELQQRLRELGAPSGEWELIEL